MNTKLGEPDVVQSTYRQLRVHERRLQRLENAEQRIFALPGYDASIDESLLSYMNSPKTIDDKREHARAISGTLLDAGRNMAELTLLLLDENDATDMAFQYSSFPYRYHHAQTYLHGKVVTRDIYTDYELASTPEVERRIEAFRSRAAAGNTSEPEPGGDELQEIFEDKVKRGENKYFSNFLVFFESEVVRLAQQASEDTAPRRANSAVEDAYSLIRGNIPHGYLILQSEAARILMELAGSDLSGSRLLNDPRFKQVGEMYDDLAMSDFATSSRTREVFYTIEDNLPVIVEDLRELLRKKAEKLHNSNHTI